MYMWNNFFTLFICKLLPFVDIQKNQETAAGCHLESDVSSDFVTRGERGLSVHLPSPHFPPPSVSCHSTGEGEDREDRELRSVDPSCQSSSTPHFPLVEERAARKEHNGT